MSTLILPNVHDDVSTQDLANLVAKGFKEIEWAVNGNISSGNTREIGGFLVNSTRFQSATGTVGIASDITVGDDIRFWAGSSTLASAPFRVYESGKLVASNADITGKVTASEGNIGGWTITSDALTAASSSAKIRTGSSGARIEIVNNSLKTYNSSDQIQGLAWGTDTSSSTYGDAFFYNAGSKIAEFFNTITDGLSIYPASGYSMRLGISGRNMYGRGTWDMTDTFKVNSGTAFNTISQSDSVAADVATLKSDFNTLLANLRVLNVLA